MEFHKATNSITPVCHRMGEVRMECRQRSTGCRQEEYNPPCGFTVWLRRGSEGPTCSGVRLLQQWSNSGEIRSDVGIIFLLLKAYFSSLSDSNSSVLSEGKEDEWQLRAAAAFFRLVHSSLRQEADVGSKSSHASRLSTQMLKGLFRLVV